MTARLCSFRFSACFIRFQALVVCGMGSRYVWVCWVLCGTDAVTDELGRGQPGLLERVADGGVRILRTVGHRLIDQDGFGHPRLQLAFAHLLDDVGRLAG